MSLFLLPTLSLLVPQLVRLVVIVCGPGEVLQVWCCLLCFTWAETCWDQDAMGQLKLSVYFWILFILRHCAHLFFLCDYEAEEFAQVSEALGYSRGVPSELKLV